MSYNAATGFGRSLVRVVTTAVLWTLLVLIGAALIHASTPVEVSQLYGEVEYLIVTQNYADLEDYREKYGIEFYPEIQNPFDFAQASKEIQERYPYYDFDTDNRPRYRYVPSYTHYDRDAQLSYRFTDYYVPSSQSYRAQLSTRSFSTLPAGSFTSHARVYSSIRSPTYIDRAGPARYRTYTNVYYR